MAIDIQINTKDPGDGLDLANVLEPQDVAFTVALKIICSTCFGLI